VVKKLWQKIIVDKMFVIIKFGRIMECGQAAHNEAALRQLRCRRFFPRLIAAYICYPGREPSVRGREPKARREALIRAAKTT
jgi:hypothetical protein